MLVHGVNQYVQGCQLGEEGWDELQVALVQLAAKEADAKLIRVISITKLERPSKYQILNELALQMQLMKMQTIHLPNKYK